MPKVLLLICSNPYFLPPIYPKLKYTKHLVLRKGEEDMCGLHQNKKGGFMSVLASPLYLSEPTMDNTSRERIN